ncbi:hypothetical protein ANN_07667 [Periplaneta americana]|uniref:Uncharacterized protein n=1 Tax=Periplaneta americana TaxID=6978 RepID=A0ABQ8SZ79_PERAM|nr:hypothetical protein ANN_07667 [Periplaneta americana]
MAGLCEGGNEPLGSLKASKCRWREGGNEPMGSLKGDVISLWRIIKQHVSKHRYQTIEDLKQAVRKAFREITPPLLRKISHTTWRRIILCRDNDGPILIFTFIPFNDVVNPALWLGSDARGNAILGDTILDTKMAAKKSRTSGD